MAFTIAHFIDTRNKGGAEVTLSELCIYQNRHDIDVIIFHNDNHFLKMTCKKYGIRELSIPSYIFYKKFILLPFYTLAFAHVLKKNRVNVLHSHLLGPIIGNTLPALLSGVKHIGTIHDTYMIRDNPLLVTPLRLSRFLGTSLVCVSREMTDYYKRKLITRPGEIQTIYNATRKPDLAPTAQVHALKEELNINPDDIVITTIGRLVPLKRIDRILATVRNIVNMGSKNIKFIIIGKGPEYKRLARLADNLGLTTKTVFTGEIDNVGNYLEITDIYTQFSSTEGLSKSIIEAVSYELPCIVSNVGGNSEIVVDKASGYIVPADDFAQFQHKLSRLISDKSLRSKFSTHARLHFNKYFDFDKFNKSYIDLYKQ